MAKAKIVRKMNSNMLTSKPFKAIDVSREIVMLDSRKTLWDARNEMLKYSISRIVVSDNGKAIGIVTEKDIAKFLYNVPPTRALNEIALKEVTSRKPITVGAESSIADCVKLMLKNHISSLLVTDVEGKVKGIITKTDIVELYAYHLRSRIRVRDFMSKKVHTVAPDETLHMIAMLMTTYNISRIVVEKSKKPLGIVTSRDFLPISLVYGAGSSGKYWTTLSNVVSAKTRQRFIPSGIMAMTLAQDIMTPAPLTINMNAGVAEAAKVMIRNRISGMPVVDDNLSLVGIITKTDIVKGEVTI